MAPETMKAVVTVGDGSSRLQDIKIPLLAPHEVLVKIHAAAQNPTDCTISPITVLWKLIRIGMKGRLCCCTLAPEIF
jgi:hypothetical protein